MSVGLLFTKTVAIATLSLQSGAYEHQPAGITSWASPHLIFESTAHFAQSAIHAVIALLRKMRCESKSRRDHLAPP